MRSEQQRKLAHNNIMSWKLKYQRHGLDRTVMKGSVSGEQKEGFANMKVDTGH